MKKNPVSENKQNMVHFDFLVTKAEAEVIFDSMQEAVSLAVEGKLAVLSMSNPYSPSKTKAMLDWFDQHAAFLRELKKKMKFTKAGGKEDEEKNADENVPAA